MCQSSAQVDQAPPLDSELAWECSGSIPEGGKCDVYMFYPTGGIRCLNTGKFVASGNDSVLTQHEVNSSSVESVFLIKVATPSNPQASDMFFVFR